MAAGNGLRAVVSRWRWPAGLGAGGRDLGRRRGTRSGSPERLRRSQTCQVSWSLIVFVFGLMSLAAPPAGFEPSHTAPEALAALYRADQRKHGGGRTGRARMGRGAAVIRALARCRWRLEPAAHAEYSASPRLPTPSKGLQACWQARRIECGLRGERMRKVRGHDSVEGPRPSSCHDPARRDPHRFGPPSPCSVGGVLCGARTSPIRGSSTR